MKNKKSLIALVALLVVGVVGATFAYYTNTATFENEFTTGKYEASFTETFKSPKDWTPGTTTEKKVVVTNTGNVDLVARVSYEEKWTSANNTDITNQATVGSEKIALFTPTDNWLAGGDGYYYYSEVIAAGNSSTPFIESVTFNPNFVLVEERDYTCALDPNAAAGTIVQKCVNTETGFAGATYTLTIKVETIQADAAWAKYNELTKENN